MNRSLAEAITSRERAIVLVAEHANVSWKDVALVAVRLTAERQDTFISDDVWDTLAELFPEFDTHEPRAMGAVMRQAVKAGYCVRAGCDACGTTSVIVTGRARASNAYNTPVYRSLLRGGE